MTDHEFDDKNDKSRIVLRTLFLAWRETDPGVFEAKGIERTYTIKAKPNHLNLVYWLWNASKENIISRAFTATCVPSAAWAASFVEGGLYVKEKIESGEKFDDAGILAACRELAIFAPNADQPGGHNQLANSPLPIGKAGTSRGPAMPIPSGNSLAAT